MNEDDGILIFGLYLDGARWSIEDGCLQDSKPGQRFSRLPELLLQPSTVCSCNPPDENVLIMYILETILAELAGGSKV